MPRIALQLLSTHFQLEIQFCGELLIFIETEAGIMNSSQIKEENFNLA
jgi:hypothetical protein